MGEQPVDLLELLLDTKSLLNPELFASGERPFCRQFIDLVNGPEAVDEAHEIGAEPALIVVLGVPQPFEEAQLLLADGAVEDLLVLGRRLDLRRRFAEGRPGALPGAGSIPVLEDLPFPRFEHPFERLDRGPEAADLFWVEEHRTGELIGGQLVELPVFEEVLHGGADEVDLRRPRRRDPGRVVSLVGMDDAAEIVASGHGTSYQR